MSSSANDRSPMICLAGLVARYNIRRREAQWQRRQEDALLEKQANAKLLVKCNTVTIHPLKMMNFAF